jgi:hypothetical protein
MNPGAPEDAHIRALLQQVQHEFGSIKFMGYETSLVWLSTSVNMSADRVSHQL